MKRHLLRLVLFVLMAISLLVVVSASSNLKYYGYYTWGFFTPVDTKLLTSFTNFKFVFYTPIYGNKTLNDSIVNDYKSGFNIILGLHGFFNNISNTNNESKCRSYLTELKHRLDNSNNTEKIWALYLFDEPDGRLPNSSDKVDRVINLTKEIFPNTNTMIIFNSAWAKGGYILNNKNLDIIGIDPYFMSIYVEQSMKAQALDPYACGSTQQGGFNNSVNAKIYWVKSGGIPIQGACWNATATQCWPKCCSPEQLNDINTVLNSDTDKKIVLVGQDFRCDHGALNISQIPDACQEKWYFDFAKKDPDIMGFMWFLYSSIDNLTNLTNAYPNTSICLGVGNYTPTNTILSEHMKWGFEILCGNNENNPFCANNSVSYKNPDQAKCLGKNVVKPGGSGNNLCSSFCGADAVCNGKTPGTNNCDVNCKSTVSPADINNDDKVDISDLLVVSTDFGKTSGLKNPKSDTNSDSIVDIFDIVFVASRFT